MRRPLRITLLLVAAALLPAAAAAETASSDTLVPIGAALFSRPSDVALGGGVAYVLYPSGLAILDGENVLRPELFWENFLPGEGGDLLLADSILYVSRGGAGLFVLDVSNPTEPAFLDTFPAYTSFGRIDAGKGRLYVADRDSGLVVLAATDPDSLRLLALVASAGEISDITVHGAVAHVATDTGGVHLYDISGAVPLALAGVGNLEGATHLAREDSILFISLGAGGIAAADLSDSSAPALLADSYAAAGDTLGDLVLAGSFVVAVRNGVELVLFDRDSLAAGPRAVAARDSAYGRLDEVGGLVGVTSRRSGFAYVEPVAPQSVTYIAGITFGTPGVSDIAVQGDTAYLAAGTGGIVLVTVGEESEVDSIGRIATTGDVNACAARGGLAYAAEWNDGLRIYDIASRSLRGFVAAPGTSQDLVVDGDRVYLCGGSSGLYVVDVSDSSSPLLVDSVSNGGDTDRFTRSADLSGNLLALAEGTGGVRLLDVTDRTHPAEIGGFATADYAVDARFSGDYLYVSLRSSGLLVLDVSDPAAPDSAGMLDLDADFLLNLGVIGNAVFLTETFGVALPGEIHVISVAEPTAPALITTLASGGNPSSVTIAAGRVYVAPGTGGAEIYGFFEEHDFAWRGSYNPYATLAVVASSEFGMIAADRQGTVWPLFLQEGEVLSAGPAYDLGDEVVDITMVDQSIFATFDGEARLAELLLSSTGTLTPIASIDLPAPGSGLALSDTLLYVALGDSGLGIYDISPADTILPVGSIVPGGTVDRVIVDSSMAYLAVKGAATKVAIVDLSDPAAPSLRSEYATTYRALDLAIHGDYLYEIERNTGCNVLDVSDPGAPRLQSVPSAFERTRRVERVDEVLFAARRENGIGVFSLANPALPVLTLEEATPDTASELAVFGSYLAIADKSAVRVYRQSFANADETAPTYAVGILPNTFANAYVDFVVVSSEALTDKPEMRLTMGGTDSVLAVYRLDTPRNVYHATYRLDTTGVGTLLVSGEDLAGNKTETSKNFSVSYVRGATGGSIYDGTGKVRVDLPPRAGGGESYVLLAAAEEWEVTGEGGRRGRPRAALGPWRLALGGVEGPATVVVSGVRPDAQGKGPGLFVRRASGWVAASSVFDPSSGTVRGQLPGSSLFLLSHDRAASPAPAFHASLGANRPNPFNPATRIAYSISGPARLRIAVYDLRGRRIRSLADRPAPAGAGSLVWDGRDDTGRAVASGVYFARLEVAGEIRTRKMLLVR